MKPLRPSVVLVLTTLVGVLLLHSQALSAKPVVANIPSFKFPWDSNENPWYYTSGPHGNDDRTPCNQYDISTLSGVDFSRGADRNVLAMAGGTVIQTGLRGGGWGYTVEIDHSENCSLCGYQTMYAHLRDDPRENPGIQVGTTVIQGTVVGIVGATGLGPQGGAHIHAELKHGGSPYPWDGVFIDGWRIRALRKELDLNTAFNYQGTATRGPEGYQSTQQVICKDSNGNAIPAAAVVGSDDTRYADATWEQGNDLNSTNAPICPPGTAPGASLELQVECLPPDPTPIPSPPDNLQPPTLLEPAHNTVWIYLHQTLTSTSSDLWMILARLTAARGSSTIMSMPQQHKSLNTYRMTRLSSGGNCDTARAEVRYLRYEDSGPPSGDGILLCDGENYQDCRLFTEGQYCDLGDFKDRIASVKFSGSYVGYYHVVLQTEVGCTGNPYHTRQDVSRLPDGHRDRVRAVEIYQIPAGEYCEDKPNGIYLYSEPYFEGEESPPFTEEVSNLGNYGWDNRVMAIKNCGYCAAL